MHKREACSLRTSHNEPLSRGNSILVAGRPFTTICGHIMYPERRAHIIYSPRVWAHWREAETPETQRWRWRRRRRRGVAESFFRNNNNIIRGWSLRLLQRKYGADQALKHTQIMHDDVSSASAQRSVVSHIRFVTTFLCMRVAYVYMHCHIMYIICVLLWVAYVHTQRSFIACYTIHHAHINVATRPV